MSEPITVLLADDHPLVIEGVRGILETYDQIKVVAVARSGQEAIDALGKGNYDLVLMDINMPVMTGDEATKQIRASGQPYSDIEIIVLTANALAGQKEEYLAIPVPPAFTG